MIFAEEETILLSGSNNITPPPKKKHDNIFLFFTQIKGVKSTVVNLVSNFQNRGPLDNYG